MLWTFYEGTNWHLEKIYQIWITSFFLLTFELTKNLRTNVCFFVEVNSTRSLWVFLRIKYQNSVSDMIQCIMLLYIVQNVSIGVWMLTKICLHKYTLHTFLKWPVFPSLTKTLCDQIDERNQFPNVSVIIMINYICTTLTCYCLTFNGRTIFIKSHSIDNNKIYVYKYNSLNWFLLLM
jgi:hypothetical protein